MSYKDQIQLYLNLYLSIGVLSNTKLNRKIYFEVGSIIIWVQPYTLLHPFNHKRKLFGISCMRLSYYETIHIKNQFL